MVDGNNPLLDGYQNGFCMLVYVRLIRAVVNLIGGNSMVCLYIVSAWGFYCANGVVDSFWKNLQALILKLLYLVFSWSMGRLAQKCNSPLCFIGTHPLYLEVRRMKPNLQTLQTHWDYCV